MSVVDIDITIQQASVTQQGFGIPMFLCHHGYTEGRVTTVTSVAELLELGFPSDHPAVYATTQYLRNSPSINTVKIGRIAASVPVIVNTLPATTSNLVITVVSASGVNMVSTSVSANSTTHTTAEVAQEFSEALTLNESNGISVSVVGNTLSIGTLNPDFSFRVLVSEAYMSIGEVTDFEDAAETITAIQREDDDFYFVSCAPRNYGTGNFYCLGLATHIETLDKMFFTSMHGYLNFAQGFISFPIHARNLGLTKTVCIAHQYAESTSVNESYPECYYVGYNAPYQAGSVTWSNLVVGLPTTLSVNGRLINETIKNQYREYNVGFVDNDNGMSILRGGKVASGEWIDTIRGIHWLKGDFTASLKSLLYSQKGGKVPYTNVGVARVREVCHSSLQRAVNIGFLSSYNLTVPLVTQQSNTDWQARVLKGIRFSGILSGAIHSVEVQGTVTSPTTN